MNNDDNLDLLDLDDTTSVDALPDAAPFVSPRPKKPWLLLGVGVLVIILATYIIVRTIGGDSSSSIEVDLDAPAVVVDTPGDTIDVPPLPIDMPVAAPMPAPVPGPAVKPAPVHENVGTPVRVIEDRKPVTFNPDAPAPAAKPAPKPQPQAKKPAVANKPAAKPAPKKQVAAANGSWYVQFGSYSTRALAENAGKKLRAGHSGLFNGRQFVVLAAVMKDGNTLYRLRVPFATSADANSFCRNAKSDGVDCYVAK
ncbi:MAG: SPOR domain-containing protein [Alphaproteobacteria bacterium]|nr:SPOR domain-containing protein [Alphaproteobacteria bacterium]